MALCGKAQSHSFISADPVRRIRFHSLFRTSVRGRRVSQFHFVTPGEPVHSIWSCLLTGFSSGFLGSVSFRTPFSSFAAIFSWSIIETSKVLLYWP